MLITDFGETRRNRTVKNICSGTEILIQFMLLRTLTTQSTEKNEPPFPIHLQKEN